MNILIADDEEAVRRMLEEALATLPDTVVQSAQDGAEAWWWLSSPVDRYSLVVLDIKMPRVDGFAVLERMRQTNRLKNVPVIMCSGHTERPAIGKAALLGVNHYLMKPFNPSALVQKAKELIFAATSQYRPAAAVV